MNQPSIFTRDLWGNQEKRLIDLLVLALVMLDDEGRLPKAEEEITRRLAKCCTAAEFLLAKEGRGINGHLIWDTKDWFQYIDTSIPVGDVKRPDCQYQFRDQQASRSEDYVKALTIECKRLGHFTDSSHTKALNQKYVLEGIRRFLDPKHSYGKLAASGIMIGYVQNMEFERILADVNGECAKEQITELALSMQRPPTMRTNHLDHRFDRPFLVSPFTLRHIWADLRIHYNRAN